MLWGNRQFGGLVPRVAPRLLPDNAAQVSRNVWLSRGQLDPIPTLRTVAGVPPLSSGVKSIFRYDATRWFVWNIDVDVVRSPIHNDTLMRTIWTGDDYPRHTTSAILSGFSSPGKPNSRRLGIPAPEDAPDVTLGSLDPDEEIAAESHAWIYTFVSDLEEEGPPSPASRVLTRRFDDEGNIAPVTITMATSVPASWGSNAGINRKRLYRTATGTTGTSYAQVAEVPIATAEVTDTTLTGALGAGLVSGLWDPPPENLEGLIALPNGVLAGFTGRDLYFSEPYQPHAWPQDYLQTVDYDIVGLGNFGTNVIVGTNGHPYLVSGSHPAAAAAARMEFNQPCVSKRSFAPVDRQGTAYASHEGLILVGPAGGDRVSRTAFDKAKWGALKPETFHSAYHDGTHISFQVNSDAQRKAIALDPEGQFVTETLDNVLLVYHDTEHDAIYVVDEADNRLKEWRTVATEQSPTYRTMTWRGKLHVERPRTFSAAQVVAGGYPLTFKLIADGVEKVSIDVQSRAPFRLPVGVVNAAGEPIGIDGSYAEWEFELSGSQVVREVRIGAMQDMIG